MQKDLDTEAVAKLGRIRERWRFLSEGMNRQPREQQLALNIQSGQQQDQAAAVFTATSGRQQELSPRGQRGLTESFVEAPENMTAKVIPVLARLSWQWSLVIGR